MATIVHHDPRYWVVIPAAGVGQRMSANVPKQYLQFQKKTLIEHAIAPFFSLPIIEQVIVALHPDDLHWNALKISLADKVQTTVGGHERAVSVLNALKAIAVEAHHGDWVIVHDAARPFVTSQLIHRLIHALQEHPVGGLLAIPITETVKRVGPDGAVQSTVPREGLWAAQTPQMFRYGLLYEAIQQALTDQVLVTDESSAIEYAGHQPKIVEGDWKNMKMTRPADLQRMQICE